MIYAHYFKDNEIFIKFDYHEGSTKIFRKLDILVNGVKESPVILKEFFDEDDIPSVLIQDVRYWDTTSNLFVRIGREEFTRRLVIDWLEDNGFIVDIKE